MSDLTALTPEEKLTAAKINLLRKHPFFGYALLKVPVVTDKEAPRVRGLKIVVRWDILETQSVVVIMGLLAHEILHFLLRHHIRGKEFRRKLEKEGFASESEREYHFKMNIAEDIVVNAILVKNGFFLLKGSIVPDYDGIVRIRDKNGQVITIKDPHTKAAEEVYYIIKDAEFPDDIYDPYYNPPAYFDPGDGDSLGGDGESNECRTSDSPDLDPTELLTKAYVYARMQGKEPLGIGAHIEKLLKPKINWRCALRRFVTQIIPFDYTYLKPSKKSTDNIILPSVRKDLYLKGVVAIDSSGSISDEELEQFVTEVYEISKNFQVDLTVLVCDAAIHVIHNVRSPKDVIDLIKKMRKKAGRGGTSFIPVFAEARKYNPHFLIYFTDGCGTYPEKPPEFPVIWIIPKDGVSKVPFGRIIRIDA